MTEPRDKGNWAEPVEKFEVGEVSPEAANLRIVGGRLTGPLQGFGQMWQKTYRLPVGDVLPEEVIATWKAEYARFWPEGNRFYAPITGIRPGEVGLIKLKQGPVKLSTGVMVMYADETSFTYMTPEGHPFAGWITFSSFQEGGETFAQVQLLIRANDPMIEVAFMTFGSKAEDRFWDHTLRALAEYFGASGDVETIIVKVDRKRQWRRIGNIRHNSMLRIGTRKRVAPKS